MACREMNGQLRTIFEEGEMEYGEDVKDELELERRFRIALTLRNNRAEKTMGKIKKAKTVDLCFLVDASCSMNSYIGGVKMGIKKIIRELSANQLNAKLEKLRIAIVAYRDYEFTNPIETLNFTESADACCEFCDSLSTEEQGCDIPEDAVGGLDAAVNLSWSKAAKTRIVFHICDAPCHGREFHDDEIYDRYPDGDQNGRSASGLMKRIREMKIDYYFGRINKTTDVMLEKFHSAYGKRIKSYAVSDIEKISTSILKSVTLSVETRIAESKKDKKRAIPKPFEKRDPRMPNWSNLSLQESFYIEFTPPESIDDVLNGVSLKENRTDGVRLKVAAQPFAEGGERCAFHGLDYTRSREDVFEASVLLKGDRDRKQDSQPMAVVLKEFKVRFPYLDDGTRFRMACKVQAVAKFLSRKFNDTLGDRSDGHRINFLNTNIVGLNFGSKMMSWERELPEGTKYLKFTNNLDYSIEQNKRLMRKHGVDIKQLGVVMAFSHWTHAVTNGFLIVVDLQGCLVVTGTTKTMLLTDPAIHCKDTTRYGMTNLGQGGMTAFFRVHRCNEFCQALKLRHPGNGR